MLPRGLLGQAPNVPGLPGRGYGTPPIIAPDAPGADTMPNHVPGAQQEPRRSKFEHIMGIIADGLAGAAGQPGMYAQTLLRERMERERRARALEEMNRPVRERIGNDLIEVDPQTGESRLLYDGPEETKRGAFYQEVQDMRALGATDAQIQQYMANKMSAKPHWITADNADGTKSVIPILPGAGGYQQARPAIGTRVQSIPGGPTPRASGGFP